MIIVGGSCVISVERGTLILLMLVGCLVIAVESKVIQLSTVQLLPSVESLALYAGAWNTVPSSVQRYRLKLNCSRPFYVAALLFYSPMQFLKLTFKLVEVL